MSLSHDCVEMSCNNTESQRILKYARYYASSDTMYTRHLTFNQKIQRQYPVQLPTFPIVQHYHPQRKEAD